MKYLSRTLAVAVLLAPAPLVAQDAAPDAAAGGTDAMTCAAFLEKDDAGRMEAWQEHAKAIGMDEATAQEEATTGRMDIMVTDCESDPTMAAADAFQNSLDLPG